MRILITAGPTREYFDPVRYLSNASSGKMGFAIAAEAARRGHDVDLVAGPVSLADPPGADVFSVVTADEMYEACSRIFPDCDAAILTAAVSDYTPARHRTRKMKKRDEPLLLRLKPTPDILARLCRRKGKRVVVGFALEDHDSYDRARANAESKMKKKGCDAIVLNGPASIGGDHAEIRILRRNAGWSAPVRATKKKLARLILNLLDPHPKMGMKARS